jgi:hypothetical protein
MIHPADGLAHIPLLFRHSQSSPHHCRN